MCRKDIGDVASNCREGFCAGINGPLFPSNLSCIRESLRAIYVELPTSKL